MENNVIPFPPPDPAKAEYENLLPQVVKAMDEMGYWYTQTNRFYEVCRPFHRGWVLSEEACLYRRTKDDFTRMFMQFQGKTAFDLLGFRDEEEAMLCEQAAIEFGSSWRFNHYYDRERSKGRSGYGNLNEVLQEYADNYDPELFAGEFPAPPPNVQEST